MDDQEEKEERWFLANGHELTPEELKEHRHRGRIRRSERRLKYCQKSFFWLSHRLRLPHNFDLSGMIRRVDLEGSAFLYHEPRIVKESDGKERIIVVPKSELMLVQSRIDRLARVTFERHPISFGCVGGSCHDVAARHAQYASTFKFDIKDAFFQVSWTDVRETVQSYRWSKTPGFSGSVAYWVAKLSTYHPVPDEIRRLAWCRHSFLPQGSPSSPVLFNLVCRSLDEKLDKIAKRVGGIVSRYVDNYFFSMPTSRVSVKLMRMIINDVWKRGFIPHKIQRIDEGEIYRILGYNSVNGNVCNTRDFKRNFRGALYVLRTRLERGLEWQEAYNRVQGFMSYGVNVPEDLQRIFLECQKMIQQL